MALCRFDAGGKRPQYALYRPGQICPLAALTEDVPVEAELFERGAAWLADLPAPAEDQWQDAPATLLPPVPPPEKILCIGLNYRDHALETGVDPPSEPVVFGKFNNALVGHGESIQLPAVAEQVDYEAELVVILGRSVKQVSKVEAAEAIFGYSCGHDVSARDWQKGRPGGQWLLGKSFDSFAPVGPCLVTTRDLPDATDLRVRMHLGDETVQDSTTAQLIFDVPTLIAHLSQIMTLRPGDLIFTGTPPGVGMARKPPRFLKAGDVCEVQIEGIGTLSNPCR